MEKHETNFNEDSLGLKRKEIYRFLETAGLVITPEIHSAFRFLLKEYANIKTQHLQIKLQKVALQEQKNNNGKISKDTQRN